MKSIRLLTLLALSLAVVRTAVAADLVVIGHPSAAPLSKEQVSDLFLGKSQSMVLFDLVESSPLRTEFYKRATGRDTAQVKAAWARLVFSGKAQPPKELPDSAAVKKAVSADARAVGYIEKSAVDASVKVLGSVE